MPRISREAVAGREALARKLFEIGSSQDQVQKAMQGYDVGGGRKGLKMAPARLAEIEAEVKGRSEGPAVKEKVSATGRSVDSVSAPESDTASVHGSRHIRSSDSEESAEEDASAEPVSLAQDGSIPVTRCVPGTSYRTSTKDGSRIELTGVYVGLEKGLACFNMEDGRMFKLWADERVYSA